MASVCKFNLYPLNDVYTSLTELGYTEIESYRIAALFVYVYTDGIKNVRNAEDYNDIYRNSFANYFENNIKNLMMNPELVSDFSKTIKENLSKLNEHIHTVIDARDAELSSKNK